MQLDSITLKRIDDLKRSSRKGLAVDIDETLSWTVGYWFAELQKLFGNPENLDVLSLINKYKYTEKVPYWNNPQAFEWMAEQIYNNELQLEFEPIQTSLDFVNKLLKEIDITVYVTARPEAIRDGTVRWLEKHGFPSRPIIMKSEDFKKITGNEWKAEVLKRLYPEVIGIIDDNPGLLDHLDDYPGTVFLFDENSDPVENCYVCKNWEEIYNTVVNYLNNK